MGNSVSRATAVQNVCVYCGSSAGNDPQFRAAANVLGGQLAAAGIGLVYGGGSRGLMGEVARATKSAGGRVVGIIPDFLIAKEHALEGIDDLIVTSDMHERKRLMFERSDGFVALPGGIGTLEELIEQMTWSQLGRHDKPIVIVNIAGLWDPLVDLLQRMRGAGFLHSLETLRYSVVTKADAVVPALIAAGGGHGDPKTDAELTARF